MNFSYFSTSATDRLGFGASRQNKTFEIVGLRSFFVLSSTSSMRWMLGCVGDGLAEMIMVKSGCSDVWGLLFSMLILLAAPRELIYVYESKYRHY